MTDARYPERWLNDRRIRLLPDNAFRLFVTSLAWSVANRTDGVVTEPDLQLISADPFCLADLVKGGLWEFRGDHWLIADFEETQTTAADLEHAADMRRKARDKKRRQRAQAVPRDVPGDVPGDTTRPGQARTGQAPRSEGPGSEPAADASLGIVRQDDDEARPARTDGNPPSRINSVAKSQNRRLHNGSDNGGPDAPHFPDEVQLQSLGADRYAHARPA